MLTYTKREFEPLDPNMEDINIIDIAHALSMNCRANGHIPYFYSVAQHSINCSIEAKARNHSKRLQLACLLHDGSEAYISDIIRPVKKYLSDYKKVEFKIQNLIYEKYNIKDLTMAEHSAIDDIDDTILYYEFIEMSKIELWTPKPKLHGEIELGEFGFKEMEDRFIDQFNMLYNIVK